MRLVSALSGVWMWQLTQFGFCGGEIVGPGVWPVPLGINRSRFRGQATPRVFASSRAAAPRAAGQREARRRRCVDDGRQASMMLLA